MSTTPRRPVPGPAQPSEWLMQPAWLPALRAGIGGAVILSALGALALAWPWRGIELVLIAFWLAYGAFLVWASRYERSGTRLAGDTLTVTSGRRVDRLTRVDVLDFRHDQPGRHAWRVQAVLTDGRLITLLGVPPGELERFRQWHLGR